MYRGMVGFHLSQSFQSCQKGKITLTLYLIVSFFTTCIEYLIKIFFQIIDCSSGTEFADVRWLVCYFFVKNNHVR